MSDDTLHSRRDFIAGALAVGGALLLTKYDSATAMSSTEPQLVLYDPESVTTCSYACATLPVKGDRVRFAREVFAAHTAPDSIGGVTHYADYVLLSGCAAEQGYRVLEERFEGTLVHWKIARRRRATYSE
jgi:hypothetical protein